MRETPHFAADVHPRLGLASVPFPLWYPVRQDGTVDWDAPIAPSRDRLPIDPASDAPAGYTEAQRDQPGSFTGDPDVMDTWATSPLTPQIASCWGTDEELFRKVFPMDLRPQSHEIIRTWLFSSVVRAHTAERLAALRRIEGDLRTAANIAALETVEAEGLAVETELVPAATA